MKRNKKIIIFASVFIVLLLAGILIYFGINQQILSGTCSQYSCAVCKSYTTLPPQVLCCGPGQKAIVSLGACCTPSCGCASSTCKGSTCSDGCGGKCDGTKSCGGGGGGGTTPTCGDGTCNGAETCSSCAKDCGECPSVCGDSKCTGLETCGTCSSDCGECCQKEGQSCGFTAGKDCCEGLKCANFQCIDEEKIECGNDICEYSETKRSCPEDCGEEPSCGDGNCDAGETYGASFCCSEDCEMPTGIENCEDVLPTCGDNICNDVETCESCPGDCGECKNNLWLYITGGVLIIGIAFFLYRYFRK